MAAQAVTAINLTTLHLDKVLSDLPLLMGPKQFAYQMKLTETKRRAQKIRRKGHFHSNLIHYSSSLCGGAAEGSVHGQTSFF